MLSLLEAEEPRKSRNYQSSETVKDWNIRRAHEILREGERHYGKPLREIIADSYGDWSRSSLAWAVWKETSVSHRWLAETLNLKSSANSSQQIRRFGKVDEKELPKEVRKWKKSRNVA